MLPEYSKFKGFLGIVVHDFFFFLIYMHNLYIMVKQQQNLPSVGLLIFSRKELLFLVSVDVFLLRLL